MNKPNLNSPIDEIITFIQSIDKSKACYAMHGEFVVGNYTGRGNRNGVLIKFSDHMPSENAIREGVRYARYRT